MPLLASVLSSFTNLRAVEESRPLVGSSRKSRDGFVISSNPIDVLLRSPPDSPLDMKPPSLWSQHFCKPSLQMMESTRAQICFSFRARRILQAKVNNSLGVRLMASTSSCCTNAAILPISLLCISFPLTNTLPLAHTPPRVELRWLSRFRRDVLPAPEGPIMATSSVGCKRPLLLIRTWRSVILQPQHDFALAKEGTGRPD